jgi:uncharacterized membrane protein YbhN (UPF0104 family)
MHVPLPHSRAVRFAILGFVVAALVGLIIWRGPDLSLLGNAFDAVSWYWVALAVAINLFSVAVRASAWRIVLRQALAPPWPRWRIVFSAFCVGLLGNAALPGRVGELARVAVVSRRIPGRRRLWPTLVGSVFAHRLFDLFPIALLVAYVITTAKLPGWAETGIVVVGIVGLGLLTIAVLSARQPRRVAPHGVAPHGTRTASRLLAMARQGLAVLRAPAAAFAAILLQVVGWTLQLLAVWAIAEAFDLDVPLPAAALVLLLMNIATVFPLWPGNVGLLQAAVALPLVQYGVAYGTGFAYGLVLQAVEMSVGVGVGLVMLAREGLSFAALTRIEEEEESSAEDVLDELEREDEAAAREAVVSGGRSAR